MKKNKYARTTILACCLLLMILDSRNVISGAKEGVQICLQVIVPSLFPYLLLSNILTASVGGRWSIIMTGMLGGYPAGAQAVKTAYDLRQLSKSQAESMLTYCNQAGPAFIFGMLSQLFTKAYIPWLIWIVHILSALILRMIFCRRKNEMVKISSEPKVCTVRESLERSVKSVALICGWVILFRILLQLIQIRIFRQQSNIIATVIAGLLELSNGCLMLGSIGNEQLRFVLCSMFLSFGGLCVAFQTFSITKELNIRKYLTAKILQCLISAVLAAVFSAILTY